MAYTTIDDPSEYFQTALWTGTGSSQTITNDGNSDLQPDFVWIKCRSVGRDHVLLDSTRGGTKALTSNTTGAEATDGAITAFNTDGFTHSGQNAYGGSSETHVGWQWKANGGSRTTFTESGNNPGGGRQVNTTAGFSIIDYTGTGSEGTIAHGLGATPKFIIAKNRDANEGWIIDSSILTGNSNGTLHFNTDAEYTGGSNQFGTHSSTNITIKTAGNINTDGQKYVAYVFAEKQGYSKFGTYKGNGNADGAFVYTGFKPAWLMVKRTADADRAWVIHDNKQDPHNVTANRLDANTNEVNQSSGHFDFLSNGFKCRSTEGATNAASPYVYLAFAENPFVSSKGAPTTAR